MILSALVLIFILLTASALFSLTETAFIGLSKLRLHHLVAQKVKNAQSLQKIVTRLDEVIASLLVANNFVNTALSSIGTAVCFLWLGPRWGVPVATLIMGVIIMIFGEITPKIFAIRYAEPVALWAAPFVRPVLWLVRPVASVFTAVSRILLKALGIEMAPRSPLISEEELKLMIELGKEQGVLGEHERMMLHRIFEFGDLKVKDVMIPLSQMVTVQQGAAHDEVLTVLTEQGYSRIPVYGEAKDRIVGIVYAQEMLHIWREGWLIVLQDLIHPPFEISPQMRVTELIQEFQKRRLQIAIVIDSAGKALGLVTLENLIEEIVGEIDERNR